MIPEQMLESVPLYVLGELDEAERSTFEVHLSRSAELQQEVRNCADTFAALALDPHARRELPAHVWGGIEQRVAPFAFTRSVPSAGPAGGTLPGDVTVSWWRWAWPAAAAVLLALNLMQWFRPGVPAPMPGTGGEVATRSGETAPAPVHEQGEGAGISDGTQPDRSGNPVTTIASDRARGASSSTLEELTEARARAQRLAEDYRKLAGEYDALAEAVIPLVEAGLLDPSRAGVVALELRARAGLDASTSAGLWDRARQLVPETGLALVPDRWGIGTTDPGVGVTTGGPEQQSSPFAMAVLNREQGLGYLDLYNLPTLPATATMQLWLQGEEGSGYTPIGTVPSVLAGGSGGLVFRIPADANAASRVIITIERGPAPAQPTGPVVIEGP